MKYWYTKEVNLTFEEALDEVTLCLAEQGFGVMSKIDVQSAMFNKLWREVEPYMILWACNPSLAYDALQEEDEIGLVMPCNVIVYRKNDKVFVSAILAAVGTSFVENEKVSEIAKKAEEKLIEALDSMLA